MSRGTGVPTHSKPVMEDSAMTIYLYVKTHRVTGLKYFGKTEQTDPYKYRGSGKHWCRHIRQHGNDVETKIVGVFEDALEATKFALNFSRENNIVESKEWANLVPENVLDGQIPGSIRSEETKQKISKSMSELKKGHYHPNLHWKGKTFSDEHRKNHLRAHEKIDYEVTFPDGSKILIKNLNKFCKENGLIQHCMWMVTKGEYKQHKGFKCKKL